MPEPGRSLYSGYSARSRRLVRARGRSRTSLWPWRPRPIRTVRSQRFRNWAVWLTTKRLEIQAPRLSPCVGTAPKTRADVADPLLPDRVVREDRERTVPVSCTQPPRARAASSEVRPPATCTRERWGSAWSESSPRPPAEGINSREYASALTGSIPSTGATDGRIRACADRSLSRTAGCCSPSRTRGKPRHRVLGQAEDRHQRS